jgi:hypothetical protein
MNKIKKYKKQIFTFITIWLLLQFGVYPSLTMADTFANIVGGIALLLLLIWGGLALYDWANSSDESWANSPDESVDEVKPFEPTNVKPKRKPKTK